MSARTNPDRVGFENMYAGPAPSDIGKPQAPFVNVADRVVSPVSTPVAALARARSSSLLADIW